MPLDRDTPGHVRVENRQQRREVTLARRGQERRHDLPLPGLVTVAGSAPCTRRRARLASWREVAGDRPTIGAISSNGRREQVAQHEREPLRRVSVSSTKRRGCDTTVFGFIQDA